MSVDLMEPEHAKQLTEAEICKELWNQFMDVFTGSKLLEEVITEVFLYKKIQNRLLIKKRKCLRKH